MDLTPFDPSRDDVVVFTEAYTGRLLTKIGSNPRLIPNRAIIRRQYDAYLTSGRLHKIIMN